MIRKGLVIVIILLFIISSAGYVGSKTDYDKNKIKPITRLMANSDGRGGILDLAVANFGDVSILIGDKNGGFGDRQDYILGEGPSDIVAADFDKDENLDIAVTNYYSNNFSILLGYGNGEFEDHQDYDVGIAPSGIVAADFNKDENLDIAVTNTEDYPNSLSVLFGDGTGGFGNRQDFFAGYWPVGIVADYFNNDENLDIVVANVAENVVSILLGDGIGGFSDRQTFSAGVMPYGIVAADFDKDENLDIVVTNNDEDCVSVLLGDGTGGFGNRQSFDTGDGPVYLCTDYFDNDDDLDLAVTNFYDGTFSIFIGDGMGGFGNHHDYFSGAVPYGIVAADFDRDNNVDLAVANSYEDTIGIFFGDGYGGFVIQQYCSVGQTPYNIAVGDFNSNLSGIDCEGDISWIDVVPGATVTGSFTVENIGGPNSELDWDVIEWPSWGDWNFTPIDGENLKPEDGPFTVEIEVVVPDEQNEDFIGEIKIINSEDSDDFCTIDVSLATPISQQNSHPLFQRFLDRFPNAFPFLRSFIYHTGL